MADVVFEGVTKQYPNGFQAVTDLNLEIADGEFLVMVGPSGCGKSTTLRMIAGLEDISFGKLSIGDQVVNDMAPKDRDIAMVFQNYALYPHMTVADNIGFALKLQKVSKADIKTRVAEAARVLELEPILNSKPGQLSGGQRQRVAMGRAIGRRPSNVFVGAFIGSPSMNLFDAKLTTTADGGSVQLGSQTLTFGADVLAKRPALANMNGARVIAGIRPEDMEDAAVSDSSDSSRQLSSTATLTEALGSEIMVHFDLDANAVDAGDPDTVEGADQTGAVARFSPRSTAKAGTPLRIAVDTSNLHFFDPTTNLSIWD